MNLEQVAVALVERIQSIDDLIVDCTGDHAEEFNGTDRIGSGVFYLSSGSVWVGGSYVLSGGTLRPQDEGAQRKLIRECLRIESTLTNLLSKAMQQAASDEKKAAEVVAEPLPVLS